MKFNCGQSKEEREKADAIRMRELRKNLSEPHRRFAWLPKRVGENDCRWLEFVMCRYPDCERYYNDLRRSWAVHKGKPYFWAKS